MPDFDLLTGGFPCQDISALGKCDLSLGRSNLVFDMLRIIEYKKPKFLLLENVRNILSDKYIPFLNCILDKLHELGYTVTYQTFNSKNYGIPQNRPRVFFICILNGPAIAFPNKISLTTNVYDYLDDNVNDDMYYPEKLSQVRKEWMYSDRFKKRIAKGYSTLDKPIANCLTRRMYANWNGNYITTPNGIRQYTPMECFRLMGFVDGEINFGTLSNKDLYEMVGNGWDINLVTKIFEKMFENF